MAKWFINMKKADFNGIARKYGVSTVIARIMRNREVRTDEEINLYLNGTPGDLYDGRLMKDMECAVSILKEKIAEEKKIRIIGDYDICRKDWNWQVRMWIQIFRTGSKMAMV